MFDFEGKLLMLTVREEDVSFISHTHGIITYLEFLSSLTKKSLLQFRLAKEKMPLLFARGKEKKRNPTLFTRSLEALALTASSKLDPKHFTLLL